MQQIYRSALADSEFKIIGEAMDGGTALNVIQNLKPDVVILDLVLPVLNGIEVLKKISESCPKTQTVVVTSVEDANVLNQVKNFGAIFVLSKPFKKTQLLHTLSLLAQSKSEVKHG